MVVRLKVNCETSPLRVEKKRTYVIRHIWALSTAGGRPNSLSTSEHHDVDDEENAVVDAVWLSNKVSSWAGGADASFTSSLVFYPARCPTP